MSEYEKNAWYDAGMLLTQLSQRDLLPSRVVLTSEKDVAVCLNWPGWKLWITTCEDRAFVVSCKASPSQGDLATHVEMHSVQSVMAHIMMTKSILAVAKDVTEINTQAYLTDINTQAYLTVKLRGQSVVVCDRDGCDDVQVSYCATCYLGYCARHSACPHEQPIKPGDNLPPFS